MAGKGIYVDAVQDAVFEQAIQILEEGPSFLALVADLNRYYDRAHAFVAGSPGTKTLIVRGSHKESSPNASRPWCESPLRVLYNGPQTAYERSDQRRQPNLLVVGAEDMPEEKRAKNATIHWKNVRLYISYGGDLAKTEEVKRKRQGCSMK